MTEPIELCKRGTDEIIAYACGTCHIVVSSGESHGDEARETAERHCGPWHCEVCGCEHNFKYQKICQQCLCKKLDVEKDAKEAARYEKATKIPAAEYTGPVTYDGQYWESVEEAVDDLEEVPDFLWACHVTPFHLNAEELVDAELEGHYQDACIDGAELPKLQKVLDDWCAKIDVTTLERDTSRVVIIATEE